ncbi:T9SS type A sorting domain-containing protein [Reichenbachiella carrageenanivorans]|uniref:T9SS type A sorting domain-containing protein n=1 Tax=Reichenbachiella carrageenanivorans TaxID=2979869 RepID=A0ABY6D365_9BACT|nr:T9SS type A sorting domain-containing protein [Reichenbachiella carrageenanivorans]UXX80070.1 T9SS type A sorting domain-containing protein [Reichenbachiella carrageenanivorans]
MKKTLLLLFNGLLLSLASQAQNVFDNDAGTGDSNWSTEANWTVGLPEVIGGITQLNYNAKLDIDTSIPHLRSASNIALNPAGGTLTVTGAGYSVAILQSSGTSFLVDAPIILNSADAAESIQVNGTNGVLTFGPNSDLTLNTSARFTGSGEGTKTIHLNGSIQGASSIQYTSSADVFFGETSDNSNYDGDMVYWGSNATVTANTADDGVFVPAGHKVQVNNPGGTLILNGANIYHGYLALSAGHGFDLEINADQANITSLYLGTSTLDLSLGAEVDTLFFGDNSVIDWSLGTLVISGFRSKVLRFGTDDTGLTVAQLGRIDIGGGTPVLNAQGYLVDLDANTSPVESTAIEDIDLDEGFETSSFDLKAYITDPEFDSLTFEVESGNTGAVTVGVVKSIITISEVAEGTSTITVTATDDWGAFTEATFDVTVINAAPVVANAISNENLDEGFTTKVLDLSTTFSDPGNDSFTIGASSSTTAVATVEVAGTDLTITEVGIGVSTITVTAEDTQGAMTSTTFQVAISDPDNLDPTVVQTINDQVFKTGFSSQVIDISGVFTEPDGDNFSVTVMSDNESAVTALVVGDNLTLTEVGNGTAMITLLANDNKGGLGTTSFDVSIAPNNDPVLDATFDDVTVYLGFESYIINLTGAFSDADGDALVLSAESSTAAVATVQLTGNELTILEAGEGTSTITVSADDDFGGVVSATFEFEVAVNQEPVIGIPLFDQSYFEGFGSSSIDLATAFIDADGDVLTISAVSLDMDVVTASVSGNSLDIGEVGLGTTQVVVTAEDGKGGIARDTITVSVNKVLTAISLTQPLTLYPNPVPNGTVNLSGNFKSGQVAIYNIEGQSVFEKVLQRVGNEPIQLELDIPSGMYILRLVDEVSGHRFQTKLIKE